MSETSLSGSDNCSEFGFECNDNGDDSCDTVVISMGDDKLIRCLGEVLGWVPVFLFKPLEVYGLTTR